MQQLIYFFRSVFIIILCWSCSKKCIELTENLLLQTDFLGDITYKRLVGSLRLCFMMALYFNFFSQESFSMMELISPSIMFSLSFLIVLQEQYFLFLLRYRQAIETLFPRFIINKQKKLINQNRNKKQKVVSEDKSVKQKQRNAGSSKNDEKISYERNDKFYNRGQYIKLLKSVKNKYSIKMINQITCNSNNAIQLSRGELLNWVNSLLKLNYAKIEQLGTGAVYCQLLDLIYPGKVPLTKVNWKAKFDYEYLNNFKVLQQSFTKLNIMKHIDVEKLVKCKYQDNLEFLQWFKKIFDTTGSYTKDYDPIIRRGDKVQKQKENKNPVPLLTSHTQSHQSQLSKEGSYASSYENSKQSTQRNMANQMRENEMMQTPQKQEYQTFRSNDKANKSKMFNPFTEKVDEKLINIFSENQNEQKQFYLKKIKEIEFLMDSWDNTRKSQQLIQSIRKIILATPQSQWSIQNGQFLELDHQQH